MTNTVYHTLPKTERDFKEYIDRHSGDKTIAYKLVAGQPINLSFYFPPNYDSKKLYPVYVLIHGGGWKNHKIFPDQAVWSGDYLGFLARYYANKGYVSVSIDYRLMKETGQVDGFSLRDLYEDCEDAVTFLQKNADDFG